MKEIDEIVKQASALDVYLQDCGVPCARATAVYLAEKGVLAPTIHIGDPVYMNGVGADQTKLIGVLCGVVTEIRYDGEDFYAYTDEGELVSEENELYLSKDEAVANARKLKPPANYKMGGD